MSPWRCAAVCVAAACTAPDVSMTVDLPQAVQSETAWIEIGAFPTSCPGPASLAGGLPPSGLAARIAYAADASPVGLGKIDTGTYGFAAIARRDDCGVVAAGCSVADVSSDRSLDVSLSATSNPDASACSSGLVCNQARCVPPTADDPNAGAGCSMVLMGAGPLPDAVLGGPFVTAPAIVPNPAGGFLIAYAEYLPDDTTERLTVQAVDNGGGAATPMQPQLAAQCMGNKGISAAGLAMETGGGVVILPKPSCGATALDVFQLDANGVVGATPHSAAVAATLATHSLTSSATAGHWLLAADVAGAQLLLTDGISVTGQASGFGTGQDTAARVVRTSAITAVEVDGPSVADAGLPGTVGRLYLGTGDPTTLGNPVDQVPEAITALTALGGRAFLVTNGAGKGEDVAMRGYDLGKPPPVVTAGFGAPQVGPLLALDAAAAANRVFCAFEQQDSVSIGVIDGASSSSPQLLNRIDLASDIRIPKSAHDGPIAVAVTGSRVAVTWIAHKDALADGDTLGGYAVFACRP